jgi:hypothetical protein
MKRKEKMKQKMLQLTQQQIQVGSHLMCLLSFLHRFDK